MADSRESYETLLEAYQRERIAALERERDRLRWELEATKTNIERFLKAGGMRA